MTRQRWSEEPHRGVIARREAGLGEARGDVHHVVSQNVGLEVQTLAINQLTTKSLLGVGRGRQHALERHFRIGRPGNGEVEYETGYMQPAGGDLFGKEVTRLSAG